MAPDAKPNHVGICATTRRSTSGSSPEGGGFPPQRIFTRLVDRRYGIDRFIEEKRRVAFGDVQKAPDFGFHRNDLCETPPKLPRETYREARIPASKAHS